MHPPIWLLESSYKNILQELSIIYYVSKNLNGPPVSYSDEENIALAIVFFVQKLHHYILTHTTKVVTNFNPMDFLLIW